MTKREAVEKALEYFKSSDGVKIKNNVYFPGISCIGICTILKYLYYDSLPPVEVFEKDFPFMKDKPQNASTYAANGEFNENGLFWWPYFDTKSRVDFLEDVLKNYNFED